MLKLYLVLTITFFSTVLSAQEVDSSLIYSQWSELEDPPKNYVSESYSGIGYYYDTEGKKHNGKIKLFPTTWRKYIYSTAFMNFKDSLGDWWIIYPESIHSVFISSNHFIVGQDFELSRTVDDNTELLTIDYEFLRVIEKGRITLYEIGTSRTKIEMLLAHEFVKKDNGNLQTLTVIGHNGVGPYRSISTKLLLELIEDNPKIYKKWASKRENVIVRNHKYIIQEYNQSQ